MLPVDSSRLYRNYSRQHGINVDQEPHYNIDNWLNPASLDYKPEVAQAVFYYTACAEKEDRLCVCIHTHDMKTTAWKYAHRNQLILDGTFGICNSRMLLFIALGVDGFGKGIPLACFLFSAPTGSQATHHAGYDSTILEKILKAWKQSLGSRSRSG